MIKIHDVGHLDNEIRTNIIQDSVKNAIPPFYAFEDLVVVMYDITDADRDSGHVRNDIVSAIVIRWCICRCVKIMVRRVR